MTKNEDKLLKDFFDSKRQKVEDKGFTRRVMRRLPVRRKQIAQVWTVAGTLLAVLLFFALDGLQLVLSAFREGFILALQNGAEHMDLKTLGIIVVVCMGLVIQRISSYSL